MCKSLPLCPGSFCSEIQMLNSCIELKGPCAWSELIGDCCQVDWFPFGRSEWLHLPIVKANKWWDTPPVSSRSPACFPSYMPQRWLCLLLCGFANHALWQVFFFFRQHHFPVHYQRIPGNSIKWMLEAYGCLPDSNENSCCTYICF